MKIKKLIPYLLIFLVGMLAGATLYKVTKSKDDDIKVININTNNSSFRPLPPPMKKEKDSEIKRDFEKPKDEKEKIHMKKEFQGEMAILIDDSGNSLELAREFENLRMPLSFAIIPYLSKSKETNEFFSSRGYTVLLHLPMEGSDEKTNSNTKNLLRESMSKEEIEDIFLKALDNVGYVKGFNNHMGSKFTSSDRAMTNVLSIAKEKGMFYVDSKTTGNSKGFSKAKEMGIPTAECIRFLDNSKKVEDIEKEIEKSMEIAKKRKKVLVIGHFHKNMVEALKNKKELIDNSGIRLIFVSEILE